MYFESFIVYSNAGVRHIKKKVIYINARYNIIDCKCVEGDPKIHLNWCMTAFNTPNFVAKIAYGF